MKIAITGGIGSGKTSVSKIIEELGYDVIKADDLAKEILLTDQSVKSMIIEEFGKDSFIGNELNTKYLAEKVFSNEENVKKVNSFVHPPTIEKIKKLAAEILKEKNIVFIESALVYEAQIDNLFDYVLVVSADQEIRLNRVVERDNLNKEDVLMRMENQISEKEKQSLADFVIENNSTLEKLNEKTKFFINLFERMR